MSTEIFVIRNAETGELACKLRGGYRGPQRDNGPILAFKTASRAKGELNSRYGKVRYPNRSDPKDAYPWQVVKLTTDTIGEHGEVVT